MSLSAPKREPVPVEVDLQDGKLQAISSDIRNQVFQWMLDTRHEKFKKFLKWLQLFRWGVWSAMRGDLMEHYYSVLRFTDDVGDGHHPLPEGHRTRPEYIQDKLAFARDPSHPKDAIDQVLMHCYHMAEKLGFSLQPETEDMLQSILFDAERQGKNIVYPHEVLDWNFYRLDIDGTESGSLKIFGEDPKQVEALKELGIATRKFYNLRDFREDIDVDRLINIPREQMEQYEIDVEDLKDPDSPGVRKWFQQEASVGMDLLAKHHSKMHGIRWKKLVTKLTLEKVYVAPAQEFFANVLRVK